MYSYISGQLVEKNENYIVIDCNGIGYEIFVCSNTTANIGNIGDIVKVYTFFQVREDSQTLYGFLNLKEKELFLNLITVSGVGAKVAMTILSSVSINEFISSVISSDTKLLSSIKGVGKKTAERIILELKSKFKSFNDMEILNNNVVDNSSIDEATSVLINMGIGKLQAYQLAKSVYEQDDTTEQIITKSLKSMK